MQLHVASGGREVMSPKLPTGSNLAVLIGRTSDVYAIHFLDGRMERPCEVAHYPNLKPVGDKNTMLLVIRDHQDRTGGDRPEPAAAVRA
jgi:hypothetical protein